MTTVKINEKRREGGGEGEQKEGRKGDRGRKRERRKEGLICKDVEKLTPLCTAGRNLKWYTQYKNSIMASQNIKNKSTI
jgi:hypothetical protein